MQVRVNKARPLAGDFARNLRVAVSWKVGEDQFCFRLARPADLKKIDGLRAPRSIAGLRDLRAHQRINYARFSNVGSPKKSYFGQAGRREVARSARRQHEPG